MSDKKVYTKAIGDHNQTSLLIQGVEEPIQPNLSLKLHKRRVQTDEGTKYKVWEFAAFYQGNDEEIPQGLTVEILLGRKQVEYFASIDIVNSNLERLLAEGSLFSSDEQEKEKKLGLYAAHILQEEGLLHQLVLKTIQAKPDSKTNLDLYTGEENRVKVVEYDPTTRIFNFEEADKREITIIAECLKKCYGVTIVPYDKAKRERQEDELSRRFEREILGDLSFLPPTTGNKS